MKSLILAGVSIAVLGLAGCHCPDKDKRRHDDHDHATARVNPVIVHIVSRQHTVTVRSGPDGLLYSLIAANGKTVVAEATADQLAEIDPGLYRQLRDGMAVHNDGRDAVAWAGL